MIRADKRKFHYLYKINRFDGKFYYGIHSTDNLDDGYLGSGTYLWHSKKKHGIDKHSKEILFVYSSRKEALAKEKEIVNDKLLEDVNCMNLTRGGKASTSGKIYYNSYEHAEKISNSLKGRNLSEEVKHNISKGVKLFAAKNKDQKKLKQDQIDNVLMSDVSEFRNYLVLNEFIILGKLNRNIKTKVEANSKIKQALFKHTSWMNFSDTIQQRMYHILTEMTSYPECKSCGNKHSNFQKLEYTKCCSKQCRIKLIAKNNRL
jgi:hypothetical protein